KAPVTAMTVISGIGGVIASALGSENANIAGPTTAVMNSEDAGPFEGRYVAGALSGVTYVVLGIFAGVIVSLIGALPAMLATTLLGMVLVSVVSSTIKETWGEGKYVFAAFF